MGRPLVGSAPTVTERASSPPGEDLRLSIFHG